MSKTIIPANYTPALNLYDTQRAIGTVKRLFADTLCATLNLYRVSAPLFVEEASGLNDNLNGYERPVSFDIPDVHAEAQVVHSLAKWKRLALKRYQFNVGKGLFTDMNAIRRDEEVDNLHSVYVDQWDWEKVIAREDRNTDYLKRTVRDIVGAVCETNDALGVAFPSLHTKLDREVFFITTQELEDMYPDKTPKERENEILRQHHTVFLMQIGGKLKSGKPHDGRAPDYDDWDLNGEIVKVSDWENRDAVPILAGVGLTKTMAPRTDDTIKHYPLPKVDSSWTQFYENVFAALRGEEEQLITHDQQRRLLKLVDAIFESGNENKVVFFDK